MGTTEQLALLEKHGAELGRLKKENEELRGLNQEIRNLVDELHDDLLMREGTIQYLEDLNKIRSLELRNHKHEIVEIRKVLIDTFNKLPSCGDIRVKRMGELDKGPFVEAMKKKYNKEEAEVRASKLCSLWEEHLSNAEWYPFELITLEGEETAVMTDNALNELKTKVGECDADDFERDDEI